MSQEQHAQDEIWGTGPFDNSEAKELLEDIASGVFDPVHLLPDRSQRHLNADEGQVIVALAALAAADDADLPEGIEPAAVAGLREPANRERLRQSREAVLADASVSGLYERWQLSDGQLLEWKAQSWVDLS